VVATAGVLCSLPVGYAAADILYRRRSLPVVRHALDLIVNLPLGIPAVVFGAGFFFTYTRPPFVLYGTNWVIILVYVTIMLPFTTRMQLAARMALGDTYEAASRVSGASPARTHASIILPLTRGAMSGAAALMFVLLSHEFSASLLVRSSKTQVMGTIVYDLWTQSTYPNVAAMALLMCVVVGAGVTIAVKLGGGADALERI
jgi:iron(III) transport system permease protein